MTREPANAPGEPAEVPSTPVSTRFYLVGAVALAALSLLFEGLARLSADGRTPALDHAALDWVVRHRDSWPALTHFLRAITVIGTPLGGTVAALLVVVLLVVLEEGDVGRVRKSELAVWVGSLLGGALLCNLLKPLYHRVRAPEAFRLVVETTYSFPSAHSVFSAVYFATLAILLERHVPRRRPGWKLAVGAACLVSALTVAGSRVWLGAHYLTDVTAGLLAGSAWVLLVAVARRAWFDYARRRRGLPPVQEPASL